jgi:hypothetical protein
LGEKFLGTKIRKQKIWKQKLKIKLGRQRFLKQLLENKNLKQKFWKKNFVNKLSHLLELSKEKKIEKEGKKKWRKCSQIIGWSGQSHHVAHAVGRPGGALCAVHRKTSIRIVRDRS